VSVDPPVLDLRSLPERYPEVGRVLLHRFGPPRVIRLCGDFGTSINQRKVVVDRRSRQKGFETGTEECEIHWEGLLEEWKDDLIRLAHVCNSEQLTEDAAVGVMSLLVHALEGARDLKVVPIGSGGDYLVYVEGEELLIEVSGLDNPDRRGRCSQRLREKTAQVLSKRSVGFVSITTFRYPNSTDAHSYLHFVVRPETMDNQKKPRSRKRK
jgi:hypothetical protein